jgi:SAM-dependent methyltransferase
MIDRILDGIPDKKQDKNTTSLKFKRDLIEYLGEDYKDKICLEVGTSKGYSTRILSFLFKKVITIENNLESIDFAKEFNTDIDNIDYYQGNVYQSEWDFDDDIQVVFIDCNHEISYVLSDIQNAINLCKDNQELLLIFDDYGLDNPWEGVKEAIQKYDDNSRFSIVKEIGQPKGWNYRADKFLKEVEGIICKYINKDGSYNGS